MKTLFAKRQSNIFEPFANPQFKISQDYQIIDQVLDKEDIIRELAKDFPDVATGRNRIPAEQTLRFLVLKHQRRLSYRELEHQLNVNLEDRWFCKITGEAPCFKTIQNQLSQIKEETIKTINDRVMQEARKRKLTQGKRMRLDSTVAGANIHYPTDASLMADGIRVITRNLTRFKIIPQGFRTFKRKIRQQLNLIRTLGRKNKEVREKALRELIKIAKTIVKRVKPLNQAVVKHSKQILEKIVSQTEQVLANKKVKDRIVSVFEPTARPIVKGKADKKCEFGQEVQIQEDEHFITNWQINNKSNDTNFFPQALEKHQQLFRKPPKETATDRSYWSPTNYQKARDAGVKHISIPKKGKLSFEEKELQSTFKFKELQRWRAGGEAKISWLKRKYGLGKCRYSQDAGLARWVSCGILACNLITMARLIAS